MEYCRPTRSGSAISINRPSPALDSPSRSSSANASSPDHLYLFPDTSTPRSPTSTSQKATPVWLQYLSQILSRPAKQATPAQSVQQSNRPVLDISPTFTKLLPYASRTKKRALSSRAPKLDYETTSRNTMAPRRSSRQVATVSQMRTRSRAIKETPAPNNGSRERSPPVASSPPSSLATSPAPINTRKRKFSPTRGDEPEGLPKPKSSQDIDEKVNGEDGTTQPGRQTQPLLPDATDGTIRTRPASSGGTPESRSPRKPTRGNARGGRGGGYGGGRGRGRGRGRGGRGGESPEPPNRRRNLTQDERVEISMLKARQHELKRFFAVVGAQQVDILEQLALRDLSKMARKPKAHKHVPEYELVTEDLAARSQDIQTAMQTRHDLQVEFEQQRMEREKEVIEQQFQTRVAEARKEHLAGAEGDIILFERAYRAAHDDTHTESGSDMDYLPRYHELPEADAQPRGYVSSKIMDEKPFKQQLESYDEQARQEVLNEDIIAPLLQQMEQRDGEWHEEQTRKRSQNLEALSMEAIRELENLAGYPPPQSYGQDMGSSYALSTLADISDWIFQQQKERQPPYIPATTNDVFARHGVRFSPVSGHSHPVTRPESRMRESQYLFNGETTSAPSPPTPLSTTDLGDRTLPRLVTGGSGGSGQAIAPAPLKTATRFSIYRHSDARTRYPTTPALPTSAPQQFIFQPPQQPYQHQSAPAPAPTSQYGPAGASPVGQQTKIPMTFVNQTIASRNAAASGNGNGNGNGSANAKGGQRILLPKM